MTPSQDAKAFHGDTVARTIVFVTDRHGPALRRRERCLELAGIAHVVQPERRPSGTYYTLCVHDQDALGAHLALQMGGCRRSPGLRPPRNEGLDALVDFGRAMSRELGLLLDSVVKRGRPTRARLDTGG